MSAFVKVIPIDGQRVLFPEYPYAVVPEEGMRVRKHTYWSRKEKQGAVRFEEITDDTVKETKAEKKTSAKERTER